MKRNVLFTAISVMFVISSCISDDQFELQYDKNDWESELIHWLNDQSKTLNENGIYLKSSELINADIDSTYFLDYNKIAFPAYYGDFKQFVVVPFGFLLEDTTTTHVSIDVIRLMVNNVIAQKDDYNFVKLLWNGDNAFDFCTIGVFEKSTGQLIYDNLLCNIINKDDMNGKTKKLLTRAEIFDGETFTYSDKTYKASYNDGLLNETYIKLNVKAKGHWRHYPIMNGNLLIGYSFKWMFDELKCTDNDTEIDTYIGSFGHSVYYRPVSNMCTNGLICYEYFIWAGPSSYYYEITYTTVTLSNNQVYSFSNSNGNLVTGKVYLPVSLDNFYFYDD